MSERRLNVVFLKGKVSVLRNQEKFDLVSCGIKGILILKSDTLLEKSSDLLDATGTLIHRIRVADIPVPYLVYT